MCADLHYIFGTDLNIMQSAEQFRFSLDSVLLANFPVPSKRHIRICDLGCGNGIIPLVLSERFPQAEIYGLEIQKEVAKTAQASVELNNKEDRIKILVGDVRSLPAELARESCNMVTANPPYFKLEEGIISSKSHLAAARHELAGGIRDFVAAAANLLKYRGSLYMVYNAARTVEVLNELSAFRLEPKSLRFVHSTSADPAHAVLIQALKGGKSGLVVEPPLFVYEEGEYTEELLEFVKGKHHA